MGQKISAPGRQPSHVEMSGVVDTEAVGGSVASAQQDLSVQESDVIDVPLINVNETVLKQVEIGEAVEVQGGRVFTGKGLIGEIPHALRNKIKAGNYRTGIILSIDRPTVRLFNE